MSSEWFAQHAKDFQTGGGVKTIVRRFAQTAPFVVLGAGVTGLGVEGGIIELTNAPSDAFSPQSWHTSAQWGDVGAVVGLAGAAVEAVMHPFFVGRNIREGNLDEIPDMPHIGHLLANGLRRSFDHVVNFPRDLREAGGWREMQLNLGVFVPAGVVVGGGGGFGTDAVVESSSSTVLQSSAVPTTELFVGGMAVGVALGGIIAAEVTTAPTRSYRRMREGLTTPRTLSRRRKASKKGS